MESETIRYFCGNLRKTMVRRRSRLEEKSHKEGPVCGRMPYELASGNKSHTVPESAKNLIRRESHKEGPNAGGRMPYEPGFLMIRGDAGSVRVAGKETEKGTRYSGGKYPASL